MLKRIHVGWVVPDAKHSKDKFLAKCKCGTEGRFVTEKEARDWMQEHLDRRMGEWKK